VNLTVHYCDPITTDDYIWCRVPGDPGELWSVMLHDLMPDELWDLPQEIERDCGWIREDGETVGIEILDGDRRHSVSYANPDFCCADVACAVANHVRTIVKQID